MTLTLWLLAFGMGTLLLWAGYTLLASGSAGDAGGAVLQVVAGGAAAGLAFWAVGAPLLLGTRSAVLAFDTDLLMTLSHDSAATEFYHLAVAVVGGAMVTAVLAGRRRLRVGVFASAVLGGVVYPVAGHWVWFGWLRPLNGIDFGGALAVNVTAAVMAGVAVVAVGPRAGRDPAGGDPSRVGVGVLLLVVGWVPYLLGGVMAHPTLFTDEGEVPFSLALTATNAVLAAAAGLGAAMVLARVRRGRADPPAAYAGLLGGLVAVSAGCFAVGNLGAVLIGVVAGLLVPAAAVGLARVGLDDPTGVVAIGGVGGVWGTLAAALFAAHVAPQDRLRLLAVQALGLTAVLALAVVAAAVTVGGLRLAGPLRATAGAAD